MSVINTLRRQSFWALDFLKGSQITKRVNDLAFILENYQDPKSVNLRTFRLENLIKHATETVPFYMALGDVRALSDFPIINKNLIRDNFDTFRSSEFNGATLFSKYTSGSTGTPFRIYHDKNKKLQNTADTLYFARKAGFELGHKLVYLRHWDQYNRKNKLAAFVQNILMHSVADLKDQQIASLIQKITEDKGPKAMLSYASALTTICNYLTKTGSKPIDANMRSIIAMSEYLSPDIKEQLRYYFGVEGLSRYSNVENGIIAQQFPGSPIFHINWASYKVEILELNSDKPAAIGKPGRIVITDLFNYSMPLIRYDTGDIGYLKNDDPFNGAPYLKHVEGRKMDMIYNTKGELITSYITYHLLKYDKIKQFQLIQEDHKTYIIKLNVYDDFDQQNYIIDEFKTHLGEDANIKVIYVNDIPLLHSGKRKLVINKVNSM
ncbi:CoF synthetase [Galbibacter sp.]|uniref:CoF synthetase n=1 Tax=Galbibacter sp. TaxID=2918471 RepID=UPI002BDE46E6|nr:CoF synthetase [Galbibacter sp.]HLV61773.1 hypothetical protein [Galbibacter sp.]